MVKTESKNINLRIDKNLLDSIKLNAKELGNSTTKEINEMLWLALKPRTEQIKSDGGEGHHDEPNKQ